MQAHPSQEIRQAALQVNASFSSPSRSAGSRRSVASHRRPAHHVQGEIGAGAQLVNDADKPIHQVHQASPVKMVSSHAESVQLGVVERRAFRPVVTPRPMDKQRLMDFSAPQTRRSRKARSPSPLPCWRVAYLSLYLVTQ